MLGKHWQGGSWLRSGASLLPPPITQPTSLSSKPRIKISKVSNVVYNTCCSQAICSQDRILSPNLSSKPQDWKISKSPKKPTPFFTRLVGLQSSQGEVNKAGRREMGNWSQCPMGFILVIWIGMISPGWNGIGRSRNSIQEQEQVHTVPCLMDTEWSRIAIYREHVALV